MQNKIVVKLKNPLIDLKKFEKCISNDKNRIKDIECSFDFEKKRLQYTNSHMVVHFNLEIIEQEGEMTNKIVKPTDVSFLLNMKLPKEVKAFDTEYHFTETEMSVVKNGIVYWKTGYIDPNYPDFSKVFNKFVQSQSKNVELYNPDMLKLAIDLIPKCTDFNIEMKKNNMWLKFDGGDAFVIGSSIK